MKTQLRNEPVSSAPTAGLRIDNLLALSALPFNHFLDNYRNWHLNIPKRQALAWLPVVWPKSVKTEEASVHAAFDAFRISFSQADPTTVQLMMTLEEGRFTCKGEEIDIDNWQVPLSGTISFSQAKAVTEDPFPYYEMGYGKLKAKFRRIRQVCLDLSSITFVGPIDYNKSSLTDDQKNAFSDLVQKLLADEIHQQRNFVLTYLGESPSQLSSADPVQFLYPFKTSMEIYGEGEKAEVRFPNTWVFPRSTWHGNLDQALVPEGIEGRIYFGREEFFNLLTSVFCEGSPFLNHQYKAEPSGGKVSKITFSDGCNNYTITLVQNPEGNPVLEISDNIVISSQFNTRDPFDPSQTHHNTITAWSSPVYRVNLEIDYDSKSVIATCETVVHPRIDRFEWKTEAGTTNLLAPENKPTLDSIAAGHLTQAAAEGITKTCMKAPMIDCKKLFALYEAAVEQGHQCYKYAINYILFEKDQPLQLPISPDNHFLEFPQDQILTFTRLQFDDQWNLKADIAYKTKPS